MNGVDDGIDRFVWGRNGRPFAARRPSRRLLRRSFAWIVFAPPILGYLLWGVEPAIPLGAMAALAPFAAIAGFALGLIASRVVMGERRMTEAVATAILLGCGAYLTCVQIVPAIGVTVAGERATRPALALHPVEGGRYRGCQGFVINDALPFGGRVCDRTLYPYAYRSTRARPLNARRALPRAVCLRGRATRWAFYPDAVRVRERKPDGRLERC